MQPNVFKPEIVTTRREPRAPVDFGPPAIMVVDQNIRVVRDDILPGGTKVRYFTDLFRTEDHVVYASPAQGGAQLALARAAHYYRAKATIFVAKRNEPHPRTLAARDAGAEVWQVPHGYLNVVQARAREYAADNRAYLLPFGGDTPRAAAILREAGERVRTELLRHSFEPDEVWCATGSGTLVRALQQSFPGSDIYAVQVGRDVQLPSSINLVRYPMKFDERCTAPCPFPSDPHYDRKAWDVCSKTYANREHKPRVLFWNVLGEL